MDELQVVDYPEYGFNYEITIDKENRILHLTFDLSKIPNVHIRVRSKGVTLFFDENSLNINYPEDITVDPDSAKKTYSNGILEITLKIIRMR